MLRHQVQHLGLREGKGRQGGDHTAAVRRIQHHSVSRAVIDLDIRHAVLCAEHGGGGVGIGFLGVLAAQGLNAGGAEQHTGGKHGKSLYGRSLLYILQQLDVANRRL